LNKYDLDYYNYIYYRTMDRENVTIELRNLDSYSKNEAGVVKSGDWTTNLANQITMNQGDSLFVKQSFLDTEASSSREVNIEEDITLHLGHYYYLVQTGIAEAELSAFGGTTPVIDGKEHIACLRKTSPSADFRIITEISFTTLPSGVNLPKKFYFSIRSTDIDGNVRDTEPIYVSNFKSGGTFSFATVKGLSIVYKTTDTVEFAKYKNADGTKGIEDAGWQVPKLPKPGSDGDVKTSAITGDLFNPIITTFDFVLPKGNYAPTDLCAVINREVNRNLPPQGTDVVQTAFLRQTGDAYGDADPNTVFFSRNDDGDYIFSVGAAAATKDKPAKAYNWLYGASQVTLDWNDDQGLFNFTYMHTPFYYLGNEVTGYASVQPPPPTATSYPVDRYGGIIFRTLGATTVKNGVPYDFWDKKLGFNVAHNTPGSITSFDSPVVKGGLTTFTVPTAIGGNVTANFTGADSLVNKSKPESGQPETYNFRLAPEPAAITSGDMSFNTSSYTTPVLAESSVFKQNLNFGYYLIEIDSNFSNNFVDYDSTNTKIKSIVSRYQSYESYTAGSSDGSLIYMHKGPTALLSSFNVRILDSSKQLATNIGNDNTVFLTLVRAAPEPASLPALPAPKK
jgi:hypothetical protein